MASCDDDDDFSLLRDDNHHHHLHQPYPPHHHFSTAIVAVSSVEQKPASDDAEDYGNPFDDDCGSEKRKEREEIGDGTTQYGFNKRSKAAAAASSCSGGGSGSGGGGAEYRKDREEWSDTAIVCLLEAYTEKFTQLNRGNLRGRDWEEVATVVSERCENQSKSVEQCKNKVDNLKKRYKLERHRMSNGCISTSHWPWFKQMEQIVGNSLPAKFADEDKAVSSSGNSPRQSKRYGVATPSSGGQVNSMKSKALSNLRWRRVVLKISGAALTGSDTCNIDPKVAMLVSREVAIASRLGVEVAIVVGGRNFFCGDAWVTATGLERCTAYQVGMMATVMNSILLQSTLEKMGVQTRVQSSVAMQEFAEPYNRQRAIRHLEKGRVVIFGGIGFGTGNPLFSTDIAAALRASELNAEAVLKGTNVDGVYDCNSRDNNFTFEHISFRELVSRGVTSMDMAALTFCEENAIPVVVFNILEPGNISKALCGEQVGTLIDQTGAIS
ncbi:uridylate kinase PUMPKIN, chloroplastic [Gastrolobium bilobum]|uniref:uridylate kinase PUMPKIN, chloroplastic n=1 Tax=Gastrolobium bilobum TaxID=150636 RepID=UPI002AB29637|nr:uridylate kinase PUMPKIN, chloroplastic [Gastrolobium bilobum]